MIKNNTEHRFGTDFANIISLSIINKTMKYEVTIKTTITRTYTIDADTEQDAIERATENPNDYDNEDINEETEVLDIEDYA